MEMEEVEEQEEEVTLANSYRLLPDAAKMFVPEEEEGTAAMADMGVDKEVQEKNGEVVPSTLGTTLTTPLDVPTTRLGEVEEVKKVFNAVTPTPAAPAEEEVHCVR